MNLKGKISPQIIVLVLIITFNAVLFSGMLIYHLRTNYNTDIKILAKQSTELNLITPLGNDIFYSIDAGDTLIIRKRPINKITNKVQGGEQIVAKFHDGMYSDEIICIGLSDNEKSFSGTLGFFVTLKYHYVWYAVNIYLFIILVLLLTGKIIRKFNRIKYLFLRSLIRYRNREILNKDFLGISISGLQFRFLLFIFAIYLSSLFIGIGKYPISQSESGKWRALVALEMKLSGNYVTPTLNGEYYYNKPPLFNYLLLPFVDAEQNLEFKLRMVNVVSVLLLLFTVYRIARKEFDKRNSAFITMIFAFSSFVYLRIVNTLMIDSFFALLMVLLFYGNYKYLSESRVLKMFIFGYVLTALGFLTKGYQAVFFQAVSVFSVIFILKKWRVLFSWKHILGVLSFFIIVGAYILIYTSVNDNENWLVMLFSDVPYKLQIGWLRRGENLLNFVGKTIIAYPFIMFAPVLFVKSNIYNLLKDNFAKYCFLISLIGIIPFLWGDYYPQYILMLVPFMIIIIYKYLKGVQLFSNKQKIIFVILVNLFLILSMFIMHKEYYIIILMSIVLNNLLLITVLRIPEKTISIFQIYFILMLGFSLYFSFNPYNLNREYDNVRAKSEQIISEVGDNDLYIYATDSTELNYATIYYLTYFNKDIIKLTSEITGIDNYYLSNKFDIPESAIVLDSVSQMVHYKNPDPYGEYLKNEKLYLFKIN